MKIGRLVNRRQGSNRADFEITFDGNQKIAIGFGNRQESYVVVQIDVKKKISEYDVI